MILQRLLHLTGLGLLLACFLAGCGSRVGQVSGKVTYDGKALPSGTVMFHGDDGRSVWCVIAEDGSYLIKDVPVGSKKVTVHSHPRVPEGLAKPSGLPGTPKNPPPNPHLPIPTRYQDRDKSGVTYTVVKGSQVFDIRLTP